MKKTIQLCLLCMFALIAFNHSLLAQGAQKESMALAKKYEQAYNKKDVKTLTAMYTKDAVRTNPDGKVYTGSDAISAVIVEDFKANSLKVTIKQDKSETAADGSITTDGTYHLKGTAAGKPAEVNGSYSNTLVKEKGKWKISKMVLTSM